MAQARYHWSIFVVAGIAFATGPAAAQSLVPFTDVIDFATGGRHACAVTASGTVKCWGDNEKGQVGDGTVETRRAPVTVISSGAVAVDAGAEHSCALMAGGTMKCWGDNTFGAIGDGTTEERLIPTDVINLANVVDIATGSGHTCALRGTDSQALCWGFNGFGQLGSGNTDNQSTPGNVVLAPPFVQLSAGQDNVCGVTITGTVSCWGVYDRRCAFGGCAFDAFLIPSRVDGLTGIAQVSAGEYFQCAVSDAGAVQCWGDNYDEQLGDLGTQEPPPFDLIAIEGLQSGVASVSAGTDHACAALTDGTARCWARNPGGELGDGSQADRYPPVAVSGVAETAAIEAGGTFSCAREGVGNTLLCWGQNDFGQLGDNNPLFRRMPTQVLGLTGPVSDLTTGSLHSCALLNNGQVRCWGSNRSGQLGDGTEVPRRAPVVTTGLPGIESVDAGGAHTCALSGSGQTYCWGRNNAGQVGNGSFALMEVLAPALVVEMEDVQVTSISAGQFHTCAATANNLARCWGSNLDNQLAAINLGFAAEPLTVPNLAGTVLGTVAGGGHSCAIRTGGELRCWGANGQGQIGNDSTDEALLPAPIRPPPANVIAAVAGDTHTCAIAPGGGVYCWGQNDVGQLGRGFAGFRSEIPLQVNGLASGVTALTSHFAHICALQTGGSGVCWGLNSSGQLGDNSTTDRDEPVAVLGLPSAATHVAAGSNHTCAATQSNGVFCWGSNASGQLGIGGRSLILPGAVLNDPSLFRSGFEAGEVPN
ncbi:MAG: RCC1 repeat-containing protein [Pseudomonadota bacterium]